MPATEPIRDKKQLRALADHFLQKGEYRNYTLIVLGVSTALRISDLLRLRWDDVYDEKQRRFRSHISLTEKKTGKRKTIALSPEAINALRRYLPHRRGVFLFSNHRRNEQPISRVQAWRIIHTGVLAVGISATVGCHGLRKTWGYNAWVSGSVSPVVITEVFQHSSYNITKRYLGITQDDIDRAYCAVKLF